jgi:hypothetical protein
MFLLVEHFGSLPPLFMAAFTGDVTALQTAIKAGDSVDMRISTTLDYGHFLRDLTPLMVASCST